MVTGTRQSNEKMKIKRYKIQHSIDEYTFPKEASIHDVTFSEQYINVKLTDERIISIPLKWIPTLYNASEEKREKFEISHSRKMIIWNPEKSGINDEINIVDYLGPTRIDEENRPVIYASQERKKQIAEAKPKRKKKK